MTALCGIYAIVNTVTGRAYIGLTQASFAVRWGQHRYQLLRGNHHNPALQAEWYQYGSDAFVFRVIEIIDPEQDTETFLNRERYYIAQEAQPVYNSLPHTSDLIERPRRSFTFTKGILHIKRVGSTDSDVKTVGEVLDDLFASHCKPDGRQYSHVEVARALGGQLEASYIGKIRAGKVENPTRQTILLLCQFFSSVGKPVSADCFFPEFTASEKPSRSGVNQDSFDEALRASGLSQKALQALAEFLRIVNESGDE